MKKHINKRMVLLILIILCFAVAVFAGFQVVSSLIEYSKGKTAYEALPAPQVVSSESTASVEEYKELMPESQVSEPAEKPSFIVDFESLMEINPDCKAWLLSEGTDLSYPVVQGDDNEYYLKHLFTGEKNGAGCLFIDIANQSDFSDRNSIIYGHAMNNGTMFASLLQYENQDYYEEHPVMHLLTSDTNYQIQIFAAGVVTLDSRVWETEFETQEDYELWINEVLEQSKITTNVVPDVSDRVLTLSTCTYGSSDYRFVVLGVLVQE